MILMPSQGWGVFALEYRVDGPLVAILDAATQKMCGFRILNFKFACVLDAQM